MATCNTDTAAKMSLLFLSICFWTAAGGLLYLAVELLAILIPLDGVLEDVDYLTISCWAIIASTFFLFILGIFSFFAACTNNKCLQIVYFSVLLIAFGGIITSATFCLLYKDQIEQDISSSLKDALFLYTSQSVQSDDVVIHGVNYGIDFVQKNYHCCGVDKYTDWQRTPWSEVHWNYVPISCCKDDMPECDGSIWSADVHRINQNGCANPLYNNIMDYVVLMIVVTLTTALAQHIGMMCSCIRLCSSTEADVPFTTMTNEPVEPETSGSQSKLEGQPVAFPV